MFRPRGLHLQSLAKLLAQRSPPHDEPIRLFLCIADHYEPMNGGASPSLQAERVTRWLMDYPRSFADVADSRGTPPQHTFFYPAECYLEDEQSVQHVERIAELCRAGYGDIEVHLHHDNDTSDNLRATLNEFTSHLHNRHGLLAKDAQGNLSYGFVHGNWALDNSRPDGRWCGVNDELTVLRETGCYADFTLPSAPSFTQTRTINSIYYATDDPVRPKSHETGVPARVGQSAPEGRLLIVQGPLQLDWQRRRLGILPGLENADLHGTAPPTDWRLSLWIQAEVGVVGRRGWIFVKLHTHGAVEKNAAALLGEPTQRFHEALARRAKLDERFRYFYVTARQMADLVHQAEGGEVEPQL